MSKLLIVESPAKAKTIEGYLGAGWIVRASYGHIRDLPSSSMGVYPERDFALDYEPLESKDRVIEGLRSAAKNASEVYLATDLDREGEAIAWHVAELLELPADKRKRVTFSEITKTAVTTAVANPRELDHDLVDAQQARRVVDRLVGYTLSPLISNWMRGRLSAGRVQSAGLKVIVDRERVIAGFLPQAYWVIKVELAKQTGESDATFLANLTHVDDNKLSKLAVSTKEESATLVGDLRQARYVVDTVEKDTARRGPSAPFTTSSLQQEAARKLGMSAKQTMAAAQELYQGIEIGGETTGLITYMRTDSLNLSQDALNEIQVYVAANYDEPYRLSTPRTYTTKTKGAQEAHEAIRPTSILRDPASLKGSLEDAQWKLYELIWKRTLATQLASAEYDTMVVSVTGQGKRTYQLRASGRTMTFNGFLSVYEEGKDEDPNASEEEGELLFPPLTDGEKLENKGVKSKKSSTKAPPRFTEASFVKEMEKLGIGRPSTYASIISVLKDRNYVSLKAKKFYASELGVMVVEVLEEHFADIVDAGFTAAMENDLDEVAGGEKEWKDFLRGFWGPFSATVKERKAAVEPDSILGKVERPCPLCGKGLVKRIGKRGVFISCSGYPDCKYAFDPKAVRSEEICPACEIGNLVQREARKTKRKFWSCERYPECAYMRGVEDVVLERTCPKCEAGRVLERKAKSGSKFFVCELRPDCDWLEDPSIVKTEEVCPSCKDALLVQRDGDYGAYLHCATRPKCRYLRGVEDQMLDEQCPQCEARLCIKQGKRGPYTACEMRPVCDYIKRDLGEVTSEACPECEEGTLYLKDGQYGAYLYCSKRPDCGYLRGEHDKLLDELCPECGGRLCTKQGKHGEYVACEMRHRCKYIQRKAGAQRGEPTGVPCPKCKKGELLKRGGVKGTFWGCSAYPKCKFTTNDAPLDAKCGECGGLIVVTAESAKCAECGKPG